MSKRLRFVSSSMLRQTGITPAEVPTVSPETARLIAGVKLSYAAMLKKDLNRSKRKDFIGNFNCARADGSTIVKGCSVAVWKLNRARALAEALAYLEMTH